jgi:hypothetical protein
MPEETYRINLKNLIETLIGLTVLPINQTDNHFLEFLKIYVLKKLLEDYGDKGSKEFIANRANDISDNTDKGPCLEEEFIDYFNKASQEQKLQFNTERLTPRVGYPNIIVFKNNEPYCYIDIKVTSREAKGSARDIYLSPGPIINMSSKIEDKGLELSFNIRKGNIYRKIKSQAKHMILLFRAERIGEELIKYKEKEIRTGKWKIKKCELFDISDLDMKVKIEFNASFKDLDKCKGKWAISD